MLSHYIRMLIFAILLLIGIQVPGFVDQYGKALYAHWSESERTVAEFRADAQRFFDGDLDRLIQHYVQQNDPVIHKGGENIRQLVTRNRQLTVALERFRSAPLQAYVQTFAYPVTDIRDEVWHAFSPIAPLNLGTLAFGFGFALALSLLLDALLAGIRRLLRPRRASLPVSP